MYLQYTGLGRLLKTIFFQLELWFSRRLLYLYQVQFSVPFFLETRSHAPSLKNEQHPWPASQRVWGCGNKNINCVVPPKRMGQNVPNGPENLASTTKTAKNLLGEYVQYTIGQTLKSTYCYTALSDKSLDDMQRGKSATAALYKKNLSSSSHPVRHWLSSTKSGC